jgi:hypothetical protein
MGTETQNTQYTYPTVTVYGNPVPTKKFPTKSLLKMIDSSTKNLGEVEYGKQNSLQLQKTPARPKNSKWGLPPFATVQKLVHKKKFPN